MNVEAILKQPKNERDRLGRATEAIKGHRKQQKPRDRSVRASAQHGTAARKRFAEAGKRW